MTTPQRLERDLPVILGELALAPYPDYIDDVLSTTAQRRQRPTWMFPERWLPMDIATQRVASTGLPWRQLGMLALIGLLIAAAAAAYVGSQPRLPDPFGPAVNGVVPYQQGSTIYLFDPDTDTTKALDTDATGWLDPWFAPDGRSLVVAQEVGTGRARFGIVSVDGGAIRPLTTEPLWNADWMEFSPTSDQLIMTTNISRKRGEINVLEPGVVIIDTIDGAQTIVPTEPGPSYATFLPPTGERILVASSTVSTHRIWTMLPDGSDPQLVLEAGPRERFIGRPAVSPDGRTLAYTVWHDDEGRGDVHVRDLTTGVDRRLAEDPAVEWTGWPRFSPDGRTVVVERLQQRTGGTTDVAHVAFIDVATGEVTPTDVDLPHGASIEWAPDGTSAVVGVSEADGRSKPHVLVDPLTGDVTPAPWPGVSYPSWQRLAP
jgi:Tol biopolymer transport system component